MPRAAPAATPQKRGRDYSPPLRQSTSKRVRTNKPSRASSSIVETFDDSADDRSIPARSDARVLGGFDDDDDIDDDDLFALPREDFP